MVRNLNVQRVLIAALLLGLVVRVAVIANTGGLEIRIEDEKQYAELAASLLNGRGYSWDTGEPTSLRPPLYPALLAAIWWVTGEGNLQAVRIVQVVIAALTSLVVFFIGRRVFDARVGALAAAATWLYPSFIYANVTVLTETLYTFLLMAFVWAAVVCVDTRRPWPAVACGAVLGLSALTRSVLWPLPLVLCPLLAALLPRGRDRAVLPLLVLLGYVAIVAPWSVRNTQLQGTFTVVDTMGGLNLRMGNYEHTPEDRMWDAVSLTGQESWVYDFTQEAHPEPATEGAKDKWAQRKAIEFMAEHPWTTMRRIVIKFGDFWGLEREFIAGVQQGLYRPPGWFALFTAIAISMSYATIALASIAGMGLSGPPWRRHVLLLIPVLAISGAHSIVFGHSRYHLPLVPILSLYASTLLVDRRWKRWRLRPAATAGALVLVFVLVASWCRQVLVVDGERVLAFFR